MTPIPSIDQGPRPAAPADDGERGAPERFDGSFTQQEPIPEDAIARAVDLMRTGRLHRYNTGPDETSEAVLLEQEFAAATGARYALAVTSGGHALSIALRAVGVGHGDRVLTNGFTLAPVPGAIASVGGEPVLVEITDDLVIDLGDLAAKARASGARVLMLSHMRGHLADMHALTALCRDLDLTLIEDCAHTMGAAWGGTPSGRFGQIGCFSTQTYKHINSGEGGLIITDDAEAMARMTVLSGSYMLYARHEAGPPPETFDGIRLETPNCSGRMDNLRAAILRPQLARLDAQRDRWNALYGRVAGALGSCPEIVLPNRPRAETYVGSSIQFRLPALAAPAIERMIARCSARGVDLKWFGPADPVAFTSRHVSWTFVPPQSLPATDAILAQLIDMRLPLTFSVDDCNQIARIIIDEVRRASGDTETALTEKMKQAEGVPA
ncbi:MAG: DegT/DnrJ/EryC1/StrS family aminotransferase [Pseudomonadota bacterium]